MNLPGSEGGCKDGEMSEGQRKQPEWASTGKKIQQFEHPDNNRF